MPIMTVEKCNPTKSGKAYRVLLNGTWYGAFLDSGLDKAVSKTIDCQITPGKAGYGDTIGQWTYAQGQTAAPQTAPAAQQGIPGDRFYMPFVSNVVAHAIAAGRIQTPADLNQWAKSAYDAAQALDAL